MTCCEGSRPSCVPTASLKQQALMSISQPKSLLPRSLGLRQHAAPEMRYGRPASNSRRSLMVPCAKNIVSSSPYRSQSKVGPMSSYVKNGATAALKSPAFHVYFTSLSGYDSHRSPCAAASAEDTVLLLFVKIYVGTSCIAAELSHSSSYASVTDGASSWRTPSSRAFHCVQCLLALESSPTRSQTQVGLVWQETSLPQGPDLQDPLSASWRAAV